MTFKFDLQHQSYKKDRIHLTESNPLSKKKLYLPALLISSLFIFSCQQEIDWGLGNNNEGDLLVKALQISTATNDTNVITLKYDPSRRLTEYNSNGKVNGTFVYISYVINRLPDGKINKIVSKSSLTGAFIDSIVYAPYYTGNLLSYVIATKFTTLGALRDSIAYTYNVSIQVAQKETFMDLLGTITPVSKETYAYGVNGNITSLENYMADGSGGYDLAVTTNFTYNGLKNAVTLREESYIILPATTFSKNDLVKEETIPAAGGPTMITTLSQQLYNSYERPTQASTSTTPTPPGYNLKLLYYYQP